MDNAQNIGDWGENQMDIANTRIPYASTFVQTNDDNDEKNPRNPESTNKKDEVVKKVFYHGQFKIQLHLFLMNMMLVDQM